jgi:hypothetical protein
MGETAMIGGPAPVTGKKAFFVLSLSGVYSHKRDQGPTLSSGVEQQSLIVDHGWSVASRKWTHSTRASHVVHHCIKRPYEAALC